MQERYTYLFASVLLNCPYSIDRALQSNSYETKQISRRSHVGSLFSNKEQKARNVVLYDVIDTCTLVLGEVFQRTSYPFLSPPAHVPSPSPLFFLLFVHLVISITLSFHVHALLRAQFCARDKERVFACACVCVRVCMLACECV